MDSDRVFVDERAVNLLRFGHPEHVSAESLTAQRYRALFGPYAVDLLRNAEDDRDPDAAARLGILLTCDGYPAEAHAWLMMAEVGGDVMARALLNAEQAYRRGLAAEFAFEFALQEGNQPWEIIPDPDTAAEVYGLASARCGHAGASYWMAARHHARGDQENAAYWFSQAAHLGHRHAGGKFDQIHEQIWARAQSSVSAEMPFPVEWLNNDRLTTDQDVSDQDVPAPRADVRQDHA
jgi:TPR repeat protein